jgi:hypothetical protein
VLNHHAMETSGQVVIRNYQNFKTLFLRRPVVYCEVPSLYPLHEHRERNRAASFWAFNTIELEFTAFCAMYRDLVLQRNYMP